jgi:uncharacterized protein YwgA
MTRTSFIFGETGLAMGLGMELDSASLLVMLLYAPGTTGRANEPVKGRTRIQKLMFLTYQERGVKKEVKEEMKYFPHKAGPFSPDLWDDLEFLRLAKVVEDYGYLDEQNEELQEFKLSEKGLKLAEQLKEQVDPKILNLIRQIKNEYNAMPLRNLLRYVYARYPEYAIYSKVSS